MTLDDWAEEIKQIKSRRHQSEPDRSSNRKKVKIDDEISLYQVSKMCNTDVQHISNLANTYHIPISFRFDKKRRSSQYILKEDAEIIIEKVKASISKSPLL